MDPKKVAAEIIRGVGGPENVQSVSHCMTRLRFTLKDNGRANIEELKGIDGVLGVFPGVSTHVILGPNLIPVFNVISTDYALDIGEEIDENPDTDCMSSGKSAPGDGNGRTFRRMGAVIIDYVAGSVSAMVPAIIAGGMLKVFMLLAVLVRPGIKGTQTYMLFDFLSNVPFYFMPFLIAYGASRKLGCTTAYALAVVGALLYPDFTALAAKGDPVAIFGLPVGLVGYSSTFLPALLATYVVARFEKFFDRIVPGIFKAIFVGMLTLAASYVLVVVVLGPIGSYAGTYLAHFFIWLREFMGPLATLLLTGVLPFLVMTGMHTPFVAFMVQNLAAIGYDPLFRPCMLLHNMAEGGASLGVAFKTKNIDLRSVAVSTGIGAIFAGVTEPAIYGVNLRLRRPMFAVVAGGAAGGLVAGIFNVRNYTMGYSSVLALPIFENTIVGMSIAVVVTIAVAFLVTVILGFDDPKASKIQEENK